MSWPKVFVAFLFCVVSLLAFLSMSSAAQVSPSADRVPGSVVSQPGSSNAVLDPVLSYSTYLGAPGQLTNSGQPILAANGAGEVCALVIWSGVLIKLGPDGSLIYTTSASALSGQFWTGLPAAVAIDSSGDCYVAGVGAITPTPGVFQSARKSGQFVQKFGPTGSVVYATYLGGSGPDVTFGLAVDDAGDVYVTGDTASNDFPVKNAFQPTSGGGSLDAFVAVLNPTASALVYSTYLGGNDIDFSAAIAVDSAGNAYVAGTTFSSNFPTVAPFQSALDGGEDAFVTKIDSHGAVIYSTYLSGSGGSEGTGMATDTSGDAYVTGNARSSDFPLVNPIQNNWVNSAFVSKFNPTGSALVYSTFFGVDTAYEGNNWLPTIACLGAGVYRWLCERRQHSYSFSDSVF